MFVNVIVFFIILLLILWQDKIGGNMAGLMMRYLPTIRVLSIFFVVYLMVFWAFHQMRPGQYYGAGGGAGLGGRQAATGGLEDGKEELMRLYAVCNLQY